MGGEGETLAVWCLGRPPWGGCQGQDPQPRPPGLFLHLHKAPDSSRWRVGGQEPGEPWSSQPVGGVQHRPGERDDFLLTSLMLLHLTWQVC